MIVFRVDSSRAIGTGHLMRCVSLAAELIKTGQKVLFVCRELEGNITDRLESLGMAVARLRGGQSFEWEDRWKGGRWRGAHIEADAAETLASVAGRGGAADWLIVDHYMADFEWEKLMRTAAKKIMVIDDLANRRHDCDLLLDQNLYDDMHSRYKGLVPERCRMLLGPRYALLRPEFTEARGSLRKAQPEASRIFVFFGGADCTNETSKALEAIRMLNRPGIRVDVVAGPSNPHLLEIERQCYAVEGAVLHRRTDRMAKLMSAARVAIGASGTTTWERCCMGLPSVVIAVAENQVEIAESLSKRRLIKYLGRHSEVSSLDIKNAVEDFLDDSGYRSRMSLESKKVLDGKGAARVAGHIRQMGSLI